MYRRLKIYFIGCLIGFVITFIFFRERMFVSWLPETVVLENIKKSDIYFSKKAKDKMLKLNVSQFDIKKNILSSNINFSKSKTNLKPCPIYFVEFVELKHVDFAMIKLCLDTSEIIDLKEQKNN